MDNRTLLLLGQRSLGAASEKDVVAWAVERVGRGDSSTSLILLAGLTEPLHPHEVSDLFARAMAELGLELPKREELLTSYAYHLAKEICAHADSDNFDPSSHVRLLHQVWKELDYPDTLAGWVDVCEFLDGHRWTQGSGIDWRAMATEEAARTLADLAPPT